MLQLAIRRAGNCISRQYRQTAQQRVAHRFATRAMAELKKVAFGNNIPGYEAGASNLPGIVVIQEWWGIDDDIKRQALYLASKNFRVLAVDLYKGKLTLKQEEANHMMSNLDFPNAVEELKQAAEYLKATGSPSVGTVGFCMGGALAIASAEHAGIPTVAFYGTPAPAICTPENITVPVQGHFGRLDKFKGFSDAETAESYFKRISTGQLFLYDNCDHGFMCSIDDSEDKRKEMGFSTPSKDDQELAWQRVFEFFGKHL